MGFQQVFVPFSFCETNKDLLAEKTVTLTKEYMAVNHMRNDVVGKS
jgi:hypothetical protein